MSRQFRHLKYLTNQIKMTNDLEQLAQDLLKDIRSLDLREVVIASEGRANSISLLEFEDLKSRLAELAPGIRVLYKLAVQGPANAGSEQA